MTSPRLQPLQQLRRRLTAWYVVTFCVILLLLGGGLFVSIRRQLSAQLDRSLHSATTELARAARIREMEAGARGRVVDAVEELHIPDRALFLLDTAGRPLTPDTAPDWVRAAARAARTSVTRQVVREDLDEVHLRVHAELFTLSSGAPLVAVAVADQVELEDRYAALIAAFGAAALVAVVLVAVGGSFLVQQSVRPIERSIAHMRRFMADAAHEMRTPLTVIRSRAEVALQQPRSPGEYVEAMQGVEAETRRLGRLVDDLLTLARADAGERKLERSRVFLDDIVSDAAGAARAMAQTRGVALTVDEFEEAPLDGDAALLHQLAMILLDNAVKFTPAGGQVSVRVGLANGCPRLAVEDTGLGIPDDQLPHLFERFYRGDPARSRGAAGSATDGAGLGLAIAKWIVELHGARIQVQSVAGAGTTMTVVFAPAAPASLSSS
jgi:signal transduction histidine kinase